MKAKHSIKAIAAMSENRVIGSNNDIPWNLPEEFNWFKEKTMGGILVMGRKTFESIGKPLPGRKTLLLSRQRRDIPGVEYLSDLSALEELETDRTVWIAGGEEIYRQAMPLCGEVYLTEIHRTVEGDTFFPPFEEAFEIAEIIRETADFTIRRWVRKNPA